MTTKTTKPDVSINDRGWMTLRGAMAQRVRAHARRAGVSPGDLVRVILAEGARAARAARRAA